MSEPARHWISVSEYLQQEELAETKSEYFNGEVFAMAGATSEHNLIAMNTARDLGNQLEAHACMASCLVYGSDQQVQVAEPGLYTYPDVSVVCGQPQFEDPEKRRLLNPVVIIEVLSRSTEAYDRGDKFAHYQRLPSLREYILIASDKRRIERFSRRDSGNEWVLTVCGEAGGVMDLPSIHCTLSMERVYRTIEFPPVASGNPSAPSNP
jgi:Uma2 family endonuclease